MDNNIRILILEDIAEDVEMVERKLREEGFSFTSKCVETEDQFLSALKEFEPDIILVDYTLPSYDGMTALSTVREQCPDIPFVFVSGTMGEETAIEALKSGATDYVLKNKMSRLGPAIRRALAEKGERLKRLQTEKALKNSARYWEITFNAIDDAVCLLDLKGKILRCNRAMENFLQKPIKDIVGGTFWELVYGTSEPTQGCPIVRMKNTRQRESMVMEAGDKWLKVTVDPVLNEEEDIAFAVLIISDITEIEQARRVIQANELWFRDLYDNAPIAYFSIRTADQSITTCNHAVSWLLGYDKVDLLNMKVFDLYADTPNGKSIAQKTYKEFISGNPIQNVELEMKHQNGHSVWISLTVEPVKDQEGKIIEARSVAIDITKRMQLQMYFQQAQKMEAIGTLAGGIAHDFNNMLSVILGYSELAMDKVGAEDPLHADLKDIHAAANRSRDITRQLLAFARKETIAPEVLDLNATVGGMLKMLRRLIGEDIDLSWNPGKMPCPVLMDPSQLDQILANLCVNARDAISDVGRITIETDMVTLDEAYCADHAGFVPGEFVLLAVSDDGCGMDRETMDNIFEPFFTTKGLGKGTGLGLSTVYGIVKQNKGFINVYSESGHGTAFRIYLPKNSGSISGKQRIIDEQVPKGNGETILVVEDEMSILKLAGGILSSCNYKVLLANNPLEALETAQAHLSEISLLITDVVMPEMNGRELADQLKILCPGIKCLFMSGYTANVIAHRGVLDKGVQFIQKPFSIKSLAAKVRDALEKKT